MKLRELISEVNQQPLGAISDIVNKVQNILVPKPTMPPKGGQAGAPVVPAKPQAKQSATEPAPFNPTQHKPLLMQLAAKNGIKDVSSKGKKAVSDLAVFLGQCAHETANWTAAAESFNYTDANRIYQFFTSRFKTPQEAMPYIGNPVALANRALSGKNGNGDEASGDGWKYRGRGYMHLTGRGLYAEAGRAIHPENPNIYIDNPTLISSNPAEGAKTAIWYYLNKIGKGANVAQASKTTNAAAGGKARLLATKQEQQKLAALKQQKLAMAKPAGQGAKPIKKR